MITPGARVLLDRDDVRRAVERVASEIERDFPRGVVLVGVLKGALVFLADLARAIRTIDVQVDFLGISRFAPDSGRVRIVHDVTMDLGGRDVVRCWGVKEAGQLGVALAQVVPLVERAVGGP